MFCGHCRKKYNPGARFCSFCGKPIVIRREKVCPRCGWQTKQELVNFCGECGWCFPDTVATQWNSDNTGGKLEAETQGGLKSHTLHIGFVGERMRGKSTVINALLGKEIVPCDVTTRSIIRIVWGARPRAIVHFKKETGMSPKEIRIEELGEEYEAMRSWEAVNKVEKVVVHYPFEYCRNGVEIVDTPGLVDDEGVEQIVESVIPSMDAIIMVLSADVPFSMSEAVFVRNKLLFRSLGRVIFVVNKIDIVPETACARMEKWVRGKIEKKVLDFIESIYGKDSEEYREAESALAGIRVFGISAFRALRARLEKNEELLRESGFLEFESELGRIMAELR